MYLYNKFYLHYCWNKGFPILKQYIFHSNAQDSLIPLFPSQHNNQNTIPPHFCYTTYIGDMEARERFPSAETIDKIAEALNIRPSVLFDEFGSPNNIQDSFKKIYTKTLQQELKDKLNQAVEEVCKQI